MTARSDHVEWERQEDESSWDFARFCKYRDLGPSRSIPEAVRSWLEEDNATTPQQRGFHAAEDPQDFVERCSKIWEKLSRTRGWVARVQAFDRAVEAESRGRAVLEHVEEEAEQLRLRLVAARTLRAAGLAVWTRFSALIEAGELDKLLMEKVKAVVVSMKKGGSHTRAEREVASIVSLLAVGQEAIAEGLKQERLELGEATDRSAIDVTEQRADVDRELLMMGQEGRASLRAQLETFIGDGDTSEE